MFVFQDITGVKRAELREPALSRDVLRAVTALEACEPALEAAGESPAARRILALLKVLKEALTAHETLVAAERGELVWRKSTFKVQDFLGHVEAIFDGHPAKEGRELRIVPAPAGARVRTGRELLLRAVTEMVTGALETAGPGALVRLRYDCRDGRPGFTVETSGAASASIYPSHRSYAARLYGERHLGGTVSVPSEERADAQSSIYLAKEDLAGEHAAPAAAGKRVLLVEDEEGVARLATIFLNRLGLQVTICRDGLEADAAFRQAPAEFDLVITDAHMPRLSGMDLARRLRGMGAETPLYLCTGFGDTVSDEDTEGCAFEAVIPKPFTRDSLAKSLHRVLQ
jgi:CheY-like chemotaxis protein